MKELSDQIKAIPNLPEDFFLNDEYRYLNEITLRIDDSAKFQVHVKTWNEPIRLESDGYVFFCKVGKKILCEEEPILYRVRDWIAYLKFILTAPPVPKEKWGRIGECDYEAVLADDTTDKRFGYCLMGYGHRTVYLYPKDSDRFCIEITEGTAFADPPIPIRVLYYTEVDRTKLIEWIEILTPYAPHE